MKAVEPWIELEPVDGQAMLLRLEAAGRTCYKSEHRISDGSARKFIAKIVLDRHESVLEHEKVTARICCDRGVSHEIVRHRIGSYSQESTRYCNYNHEQFGREITCIRPSFWEASSPQMALWRQAMCSAEEAYFEMMELGALPEQARSVLPNSLKTEIVVTYNLREWRHFLRLRTDRGAHPQMREIAMMLLYALRGAVPVVFDDIVHPIETETVQEDD